MWLTAGQGMAGSPICHPGTALMRLSCGVLGSGQTSQLWDPSGGAAGREGSCCRGGAHGGGSLSLKCLELSSTGRGGPGASGLVQGSWTMLSTGHHLPGACVSASVKQHTGMPSCAGQCGSRASSRAGPRHFFLPRRTSWFEDRPEPLADSPLCPVLHMLSHKGS